VAVGLAAGVGVAVGLWYLPVDRYLLVSAISSRSGSMAPSSRGPHALQKCRHCGGELVVPLPLSDEALAAGAARGMRFDAICADCLAPAYVEELFETLHPRDLYLINRTKAPRRWDRIAFYCPIRPDDHDLLDYLGGVAPDDVFGKRVVGLPGEAVVIRDGTVWIDGVRQEPPPGAPRVAYTSGAESDPDRKYWGQPDNPANLGSDEYFVLGDNTTTAADSRLFGPVPRDKILGVADVVYWPPKRWRLGP
jgi:signal peptidase I